jgi:predicted  nucleic acid-binding Zn-ribbon protein
VYVYSNFKEKQEAQYAQMEIERYSFSRQVTERDSMINEWLLTFDQIETDLKAIKEKESLITVKSSDTELSKNRKDQVLDDIKVINSLLESNKKKIASLSAQLKQSGSTIQGMQTRIASLEASITQFENDIAVLKQDLVKKDFEIGDLNTKVLALDQEIVNKNGQIVDQTNKMNTAYIVSGTYKELKSKGILNKEGGFLGLGRSEYLVKDISDSLFAQIDVTLLKTIPVNSKNAKLITDHPLNSYEMVHEGEKSIAYIEIKDPEQFWKISKYAVVEIIK